MHHLVTQFPSPMLAIDPDFGFEQWRAMKNPHLYRLSFSGDAPVLFEDLD